MTTIKKFHINTEICFGENALERLESFKDQRILIITDKFMVESGLVNAVKDRIENCFISIFDEVLPDPSIEIVGHGVKKLREFGADIMIAFGGGSAIDAAKAMKRIVEEVDSKQKITFVAIPTTSGTGSEVTAFSVISDKANGRKYALTSDEMVPDIAILDPELVRSVPASITADTGMDVITHAIEALISTEASDCTDALAMKALELAFQYLRIAYKDGNDLLAREKMHNASCIAGMAFNHASLGINHSIAHAIGGKFKISHGKINAILLPHIVEYNADLDNLHYKDNETTEKYLQVVRMLGLPAPTAKLGIKNLVRYIKDLQKEIGIPKNLKEYGIDPQEVDNIKGELAEIALSDICTATNPKETTKEDIIKIIDRIIK